MFQYPGSVVDIKTISGLPKGDENFVVEISGFWKSNCLLEGMHDVVFDDPGRYSFRWEISSVLADPENCSHEFNPTPFSFTLTYTPAVWKTFEPGEDGSIEAYFVIVHGTLIRSGWKMRFDMKYGLHEIPPRLGSGFWVSDELPNQGLTIQQQDEVAVFYQLNYNRLSGEPNWTYADARFYGNSSNGVSYFFNWLMPTEDTSVQPNWDELSQEPLSAGIVVKGYNRIVAYLGLSKDHHVIPTSETDFPPSYTYKRWVFSPGKSQLPPVVPEMAGKWNLFGFNDQKLEQSHQIEFLTGERLGDDLYRFPSIDDEWILDCQVSLDGEGGCSLTNETDQLSLSFDLMEFNGNYAKSELIGSHEVQTGILLRSEFHLPVLDLQ